MYGMPGTELATRQTMALALTTYTLSALFVVVPALLIPSCRALRPDNFMPFQPLVRLTVAFI